MVAAHDVGTGATLVFTTAVAFAFDILSINGTDATRVALDSSHMGTTGEMTKIFGDLMDAGGVDVECVFDAAVAVHMQTAMTAGADTVTIAFPDGSGATGTGAVTSWSWAVPLEERMTQSFTWTWDGQTGPTWS